MLSGFKPISITTGFPTLTLTKNGVGFNKASILKMDGPRFVCVAINAEKNMLALIPCAEDDEYSTSFAKEGKKTNNVRWNSRDFANTVAEMCRWDGVSRGKKVTGQYYADENALIFDMNCAVDIEGSDDD